MLQLEIVTPEALLLSENVTMVSVPGSEGDFGVLEGHAPFVSSIRPGIVSTEGGSSKRFLVRGGIAEVSASSCTLLADEAFDLGSFSAADAKNAKDEAQDRLSLATDDAQKAKAQSDIEFFVLAEQLLAA